MQSLERPKVLKQACPSSRPDSSNPPPCRKARQGVFDPPVWFPMFSMFSFRGPQPPGWISLHSVFRLIFVTFFRTLLFTTMCTKSLKNGSPKTPQNHKNLQKLIIKTLPQSRLAKRLRLEGAKPLKVMTVTHFELFFQRPRALKRE